LLSASYSYPAYKILSLLYPAAARVNASRYFSATASSMTATKIDGTAIAKSIREKLGAKIRERQGVNPRYKPSLKIVQGEWLPLRRVREP
jgi:hypothetical protein